MKRKTIIAIFIVSLCFFSSGPLANTEPQKKVMNFLAVMDLTCDPAIGKPACKSLTDIVIGELVKIGKYTIIDRANRDKILSEQGFQQTGCVEGSCTVEAGRVLGVGKIVVGSISKLGAVYLVNIQLINVQTAAVELSADETCKCDLEGIIESVRNAARKLMGQTPATTPSGGTQPQPQPQPQPRPQPQPLPRSKDDVLVNIAPAGRAKDISAKAPNFSPKKYRKVMVLPPKADSGGGSFDVQINFLERKFLERGITCITSTATANAEISEQSALTDMEKALIMGKKLGADGIVQLGLGTGGISRDECIGTRKWCGQRPNELVEGICEGNYKYSFVLTGDRVVFTGRLIDVETSEIVSSISVNQCVVNNLSMQARLAMNWVKPYYSAKEYIARMTAQAPADNKPNFVIGEGEREGFVGTVSPRTIIDCSSKNLSDYYKQHCENAKQISLEELISRVVDNFTGSR